MKWTKSKKAIIIASSIAGVAIIAAATVSVFMFTDIGSKQWQYDKKISEPITAVSADKDVTLGMIETHGVSVYIPAQTFDNKTSVTLSHPDKNLLVDKSAFAPAGAPVQIESSGSQRRLNKPAKITMAVDNLRRGSSGVLYIAALNEQNQRS